MKAIHRLKQYIDIKGFSNSSFEKKNNLSNGYIGTQIKRNADLGEGVLNKVLDNCLEINPEWLLTGKGKMLRGEKKETPALTPSEKQQLEEKIHLLENIIKDKDKIIALQEKQLNYTKKGDFELPPLSMVAEEQEEYPEINVLKDKKRKKDTPHNTLNRTE